MKITVTCAIGKFEKNPFLPVVIFAFALLTGGVAYADISQNVNRLFELHTKLTPGMTIEALNEILGPPDESHALGGNVPVIRYAWLHGGMGIEAYEVEGAAYRVAITLPCDNNQNRLRALDAITRQGYSKYGSMPLADPGRNEHYWVRNGIRFAFSTYNQTTVLSSSTKAQ